MKYHPQKYIDEARSKTKVRIVLLSGAIVSALFIVGIIIAASKPPVKIPITNEAVVSKPSSGVILTPIVIGTFVLESSTCTSYKVEAETGTGFNRAHWTNTNFIVCDPPLAGACVQGSLPGKTGVP